MPSSLSWMDIALRLPLAVIAGAGAIIHRRDLVLGVTTAATLWFVTVIGLCFGCGNFGLGAAATVLGLLVLSGLKHVERFMPAEHRATLTVAMGAEGPDPSELRDILAREGFQILKWSAVYRGTTERSLQCELRWRGIHGKQTLPPVLVPLSRHPGIHELNWRS